MILQFPSENKKEEKKKTSSECAASLSFGSKLPKRSAPVSLLPIQFVDDTPKKRSTAADPLKNLEDIIRIQDYLIANQRYRDNLIFTMGINVGLRCGDLLKVKVGQMLTPDGSSYAEKIELQEEKTGKLRVVYLNDAIYDAADLYFSHCGSLDPNSYLFRGEGNRSKNSDKPLNVSSVEFILKDVINSQLHIDVHASTHCLRKTFAYHMIMTAPDRTRAIEFLMKVLGHSSPAITLMYAGITDDEMRSTYQALNLGRRNPLGFWREAI